VLKKIVIALSLFSMLIIGCGSDDSTLKERQEVISPEQNNTFDDANDTKVKDKIPKTNPYKADGTFKPIQNLIKASNEGVFNDVTFIMIGDSTRVYTLHDQIENFSNRIFEEVNSTLTQYGVNSFLVSQGGLAFRTFLGEHYDKVDGKRKWINIEEAIEKIPRTGKHTIIDLSLGVNDVTRVHPKYDKNDPEWITKTKDEIKIYAKRVIDKLFDEKPDIKLYLVSPNPHRDWEKGSEVCQRLYQELSIEYTLPYINFVPDMPDRKANNGKDFEAWYNDNIHFSQDVGIPYVARKILENILPN
jgi:hypothetical protein